VAKLKPRINRHQAAYQQLHAAFPRAFPLDDAEIRPLVPSTRNDVAAWIQRQGFDPRTAKALLGAAQQHCSRRTYQATVIAGALRINLDGEPVEPVTPEGEAHAQQKIAQILAQRAAKGPPTASTVKPHQPVAPEPVKAMPTVIVKKRRRVMLPGA
jgi:sRNA-binding protein